MNNSDYVTVDGIKWWIIKKANGYREPQPICPKHNLRLHHRGLYEFQVNTLYCIECEEPFLLNRTLELEKQYVLDKIDSKVFKNMQFINLDDEAIPIAKDHSEVNDHFVTALLTKSKVGLRLVVYAGKKGLKEKTQIFVEPDIKRLAFDQKDLHPSNVFTELKGTFIDGSTHSITKKSSEKKSNK